MFLASRLLLGYSNAYNPSITSTFVKLSSIVPGPLRDQIGKTLEGMRKQKTDERFVRTMETLAEAWIYGHKARIWYQPLGKELAERVIEPYFIQPATLEHANYVIAYCHHSNQILTFKATSGFISVRYLRTGVWCKGDQEVIIDIHRVLAPNQASQIFVRISRQSKDYASYGEHLRILLPKDSKRLLTDIRPVVVFVEELETVRIVSLHPNHDLSQSGPHQLFQDAKSFVTNHPIRTHPGGMCRFGPSRRNHFRCQH